ncbi:MAG: InlB B-repeat-containing protein [Clostridiales bacterium]|nr:InlB B-repeat-containing protein [Clostridiales bacterium]
MKKSKIALAAALSAVLGTTAVGLAACSDAELDQATKEHGVYTITFDANGGAFASSESTYKTKTLNGKLIASSVPGDPTTPPAATPDYTFKGWALTPTASADDAISPTSITFTKDDTIYAIWGGEQLSTGAYTITFNPNGGTITSGQSTMTTVGGKLTSTLPTAANGDKEFLGWYTVKDSTLEANKVVVNVTTFAKDGEVYASWGDKQQENPATEYDVTFNANGGKYYINDEAQDTVTVKTSGGVIATLPTPYRTGYTFDGYYKDAVSKTEPFTATTNVEAAGLTVYAHWTENPVLTDNVLVVGGRQVDLTDRTSWLPDQPDDRDRMYSIGSSVEAGIALTAGDKISFKIDGKPIEFYLAGDSKGVDVSVTDKEISEISIEKTATFVIYLAHYPVADGRPNACWTITVQCDDPGEDGPGKDDPVTGDSMIVVGNAETSLTKRDEWLPDQNDDRDIMYSVGSDYEDGIDLTAGDKVSFKIDGKAIEFFLTPDSTGVASADGLISEITIQKTANFVFYIIHYPDNEAKRDGACWVVTAKYKTAGDEDTEYDTDGIYVGGKIVKKFVANKDNENEVMIEHITFGAGDELTFVHDGKVVVPAIKSGDDGPCTTRIVLKGGKLVCPNGGTFSLYYDFVENGVWFIDEADAIAPDLKPGDGMSGGGKTYAFTVNEYGLNEVYVTGVKLEAETTLTLMYGGKSVTDYTLKDGSLGTKSDGGLKLSAGTYDFYYDYVAKALYVGGKADKDEPVNDHTGAYIIGGKESALTNNDKIADDQTADVELYALQVDLTQGDVLTFKVDGKLLAEFYGADCHGVTVDEKAGKVTVKTTGKFDIYVRHYNEDEDGNPPCWVVQITDNKKDEIKPNTPYLVGSMNGWALTEGYDLKAAGGKYSITIELSAGVEFQVAMSDADGNTVWKTDEFTLKSRVAEKIANRNFAITGGAGTYIITLDGTVVTVTKEGEEEDPKYETDGVYVGDTLIKAFEPHNTSEVKLMHVKFEEKSVLTFVYGGYEVLPTIKKKDDGTPSTSKIVLKDGKLYCENGGTFSMYYDFGSKLLWVEDEADAVESELKEGDGMIAGTTVYAFKVNEDGNNEVYVAGVKLTAKTTLTLKYAGKQVSDYKLKPNSLGSLSGGILTLSAGTYDFYYDYAAKEMWIQGEVDAGEIPAGMVATKGGNQDSSHPNVYLVGKFGSMTDVSKSYGYFVPYEKKEGNSNQYTISITLAVGDEIAIWVPDWSFLCATVESGCNVTGYLSKVTHGTETYLKVEKAGKYTFYYKNEYNNDRMWIALPA